VSDYDQLTREEEVRLSTLIQVISAKGDKATKAEREQLAAAKERFVNANLKLVHALARSYLRPGVSLEDLVQEGNIGLMRAVDLFDGRKGFRFSTYATWWIRQGFHQALATSRTGLDIPRNLRQELNAFRQAERDLVQRLGREPRLDEIAKAAGIDELRVSELLAYGQSVLSLEASSSSGGDEEGSPLGERIADDTGPGIEGTIVRRDLARVIGQVVERLDPREADILVFRFGLQGGVPHTVDEAAKEFGLSRERIRQVEARAIARLRRDDSALALRQILED